MSKLLLSLALLFAVPVPSGVKADITGSWQVKIVSTLEVKSTALPGSLKEVIGLPDGWDQARATRCHHRRTARYRVNDLDSSSTGAQCRLRQM